MLTGGVWAGERQRHAVLQLVAETIGATGLVETGARSDPTGYGLVKQPAVKHDIHGAVGRCHLHCIELRLPVRVYRGQFSVNIDFSIVGNERLGFYV